MKNPRTFIEFDGVRTVVEAKDWAAFQAFGLGVSQEAHPNVASLSDYGLAESPHDLMAEIADLQKCRVPEGVKNVLNSVMEALNAYQSVKGFLSANPVMAVYEDSEDVQADAMSPAEFKAANTEASAENPLGLPASIFDLPEKKADPLGVGFTDEEIEALTDTDNDAAALLAYGKASDAKKAMLGKPKAK